MKKPTEEVRALTLKIRVSSEEKKMLLYFKSRSTEKSLSNYLRKLGLQKPITIRVRNESTDAFLREMIDLKKQLNGIGNNFNQAVHKLHTLDRIPEFRAWILEQQTHQKKLILSIENIQSRVQQLYQQWLQK
jgi:hypothetical protein